MNEERSDKIAANKRLRMAIEHARKEPVPSESLAGALDAAARIASEVPATGTNASSRARLIRKLLLASACVVAFLACLLVVFTPTSPGVGLAETGRALGTRGWIHVKSSDWLEGQPQQDCELWFSPTELAYFRRDDGWIEHHDHARRESLSYDRREESLVRVPYEEVGQPFYSAVFDVLQTLFEAELGSESPMACLAELDDDLVGLELLEFQQVALQEGSRSFLEYRMEAGHHRLNGPMSILMRVELPSRLPSSVQVEGRIEGRSFRFLARFDYPEHGPENIFAVGVPADAPIVEARPPVDVSPVVAQLRAGRREFDDYRAISVPQLVDVDGVRRFGEPVVFYRKGDGFRVDFPSRGGALQPVPVPAIPIASGETLAGALSELIGTMTFTPRVILRGGAAYWYVEDGEPASDGRAAVRLERIEEDYPAPLSSEHFLPPYFSWSPECIARPALGIPDHRRAVFLRPSPLPGAPAALQLRLEPAPRLRGASRRGRSPGGVRELSDYWIDPTRGYLVIKNDDRVVEEVARSPGGRWYATRVCERKTIRGRRGETHQIVRALSVDFDVELPDSLFDTEAPRAGVP